MDRASLCVANWRRTLQDSKGQSGQIPPPQKLECAMNDCVWEAALSKRLCPWPLNLYIKPAGSFIYPHTGHSVQYCIWLEGSVLNEPVKTSTASLSPRQIGKPIVFITRMSSFTASGQTHLYMGTFNTAPQQGTKNHINGSSDNPWCSQ